MTWFIYLMKDFELFWFTVFTRFTQWFGASIEYFFSIKKPTQPLSNQLRPLFLTPFTDVDPVALTPINFILKRNMQFFKEKNKLYFL